MTDQNPKTAKPSNPAASTGRLLELSRDALGRLVARLEGRDEPVVDVRVVPCFPWTMPESLISLRDADGHELILLETLSQLPPTAQELVSEELRDKIFAPKIHAITHFEERFGIISISAESDRGAVTFQLNGRHEVRALSADRCVLKDVDGNLYEVPDVKQLDERNAQRLRDYF